MSRGGRVVPGNGQVVASVVYGPDAWSVQTASLGIMTNTFSPGSAGVGMRGLGFTGDPGYGLNGNRFGGRTYYAKQDFTGVAGPINNPSAYLLGAGSGVAGQPGLPGTGNDATGPLAWMSLNRGIGG